MKTIYFGLQLDQTSYTNLEAFDFGDVVVGPIGLLKLLESHIGNVGYEDDVEYLRIEAYRKALKNALETNDTLFYAASFKINEFAVAKSLLSKRDELLLCGWDFSDEVNIPQRLIDFSIVEECLSSSMPVGYTERYLQLLELLPQCNLPYKSIIFNEPLRLITHYYSRLATVLENLGIQVIEKEQPKATNPAFSTLQNNLLGNSFEVASCQQSISILEVDSEQTGADWLTKWLSKNESLNPLLLISDHKRLLDIALQQEGLPSLGITTNTKARPSLQLLKLVTALLQTPLDSDRMIAFLLLPIHPLPNEIAYKIAEDISKKPGFNIADWKEIVHQNVQNEDLGSIEKTFKDLFERKKFQRNELIPKKEIVGLYRYLNTWLSSLKSVKYSFSIRLMQEYLKQIIDLFESMNEAQFTFTTLHQIINSIIDPVIVKIDEEELHSYEVIFQPSQMLHPHPFLVWWNFVDIDNAVVSDFWSESEQEILLKKGIVISDIQKENKLKFYQSIQPFFQTQQKIWLIIPKSIDGAETQEHPLLPFVKASFTDLEIFKIDNLSETFSVNYGKDLECFPLQIKLEKEQLPFIELDNFKEIKFRDYESPSSLEKFIYYPHQWFFDYILKIRKANVLTTSDLFTIKGNIAHFIIEQYFQSKPEKGDLKNWIRQQFENQLIRQGATLLSYGKEPEKRAFEQNLTTGITTLIQALENNNWEVIHNEYAIKQPVFEENMVGIMDLIAKRGGDFLIIDLKYSGYSKRYNLLKNNEDLQLFFYKQLLKQEVKGAIYTAYYIIGYSCEF